MQKYAVFETVLHVILFALKNENKKVTKGTMPYPLFRTKKYLELT